MENEDNRALTKALLKILIKDFPAEAPHGPSAGLTDLEANNSKIVGERLHQLGGKKGTFQKLLAFIKFKSVLIKQVIPENSQALNKPDSIKYNNAELEKELDSFCERNPELDVCKERFQPKARWK